MEISQLDDDELGCLAQWLAHVPSDAAPVDIRMAPAWRFAESRVAVDRGNADVFHPISGQVVNRPGYA